MYNVIIVSDTHLMEVNKNHVSECLQSVQRYQ